LFPWAKLILADALLDANTNMVRSVKNSTEGKFKWKSLLRVNFLKWFNSSRHVIKISKWI
jgi:hypothetical protein